MMTLVAEPPVDHRRAAFGRALARMRRDRKLSQMELGRRVGGVVQGTVSSWEAGATEPSAIQVFALEEALDLEAGFLSRSLGYVPVESRPPPMLKRASECIAQDPYLEEWARNILLAIYTELAKEMNQPPQRKAPRPRR